MNLVARRGHGCARPVGGARVVANGARVGDIVARSNAAAAASAFRVGASANHYGDITTRGKDSVAPAVSAVQYQVRNQSIFVNYN